MLKIVNHYDVILKLIIVHQLCLNKKKRLEISLVVGCFLSKKPRIYLTSPSSSSRKFSLPQLQQLQFMQPLEMSFIPIHYPLSLLLQQPPIGFFSYLSLCVLQSILLNNLSYPKSHHGIHFSALAIFFFCFSNFYWLSMAHRGLPWWLSVKESASQ